MKTRYRSRRDQVRYKLERENWSPVVLRNDTERDTTEYYGVLRVRVKRKVSTAGRVTLLLISQIVDVFSTLSRKR